MVELPDPRKRLVIREKTFKVDLPENGETGADPGQPAAHDGGLRPRRPAHRRRRPARGAGSKRRRERDEQRFEEKLGE